MTNPTHFEIFLRYLDTYVKPLFTPFIKLGEKTKVPDGNWKQERYHISKEEALTRLKKGNNVGIVAHSKGLVFLDFDVEGGKTILPGR